MTNTAVKLSKTGLLPLQKYRLYLKRISCVANQQANMVAALGSTDPAYLRMNPVFPNIAGGGGQFQNNTFRPFVSNGMFGRLNSPAGMGIRGIPSSGMVPLRQPQGLDNTINDQGKFHPVMLSGSHNGNILQGMPPSLELDQLQQNKSLSGITDLPSPGESITMFGNSTGFTDARYGRPNNPLLGAASNPLMLGDPQDGNKIFGNQSSVSSIPLNPGPSSHSFDPSRCSDNWSSAVQSSTNSFPPFGGGGYKQPALNPGILRENFSSMATLQIRNNQCDVSSPLANQLQRSKSDSRFQSVPISRSSEQAISSVPQDWDTQNPDTSYQGNILCNSLSSALPINNDMESLVQGTDPNNTYFSRNADFDSLGQSNFIDTFPMKINEAQRSALPTSLSLKEEYFMSQLAPQNGGYISNKGDSLEDLVTSVVKQV